MRRVLVSNPKGSATLKPAPVPTPFKQIPHPCLRSCLWFNTNSWHWHMQSIRLEFVPLELSQRRLRSLLRALCASVMARCRWRKERGSASPHLHFPFLEAFPPPLQAVARMSQSSHLVTCPGHLTRDRNLLRVFALGSNGHNLCMRLRRCLANILSSLMVEVFPRLQHVDQQRVAIAMLIPPLQLLVGRGGVACVLAPVCCPEDKEQVGLREVLLFDQLCEAIAHLSID